jgi:class 3 adenylate cyclase
LSTEDRPLDVVTPERLAMGETPSIAARLQEKADLNNVVISAATFRLIMGFFACRHLNAIARILASEHAGKTYNM